MIPKIAAVIAFGVGAWFGYNYAMGILESGGMDFDDYWSEQGAQLLRIVLTLGLGGVAATLAYFAANFFKRFD